MTVYSNFATEQSDGRISIAFDKKEGAVDASGGQRDFPIEVEAP